MIRRHAAGAGVLATALVLGLPGCGSSREDEKEALNAVPTRVEPAGGVFSYVPWVAVVKESDEDGTGSLSLRAPGEQQFSGSWLFGASCPAPEYLNLPRGEKGVSSVACLEVQQSGQLEYYLSQLFGARSDVRRETFVVELVKTAAAGGAKADALEFREIETTCKLEESLSADEEQRPMLTVSIDFEIPKATKDARRGTLEFSTAALSNGAKTRLTYESSEGDGVAGWRTQRPDDAAWSPKYDYTTRAVSQTCGDDWICRPTPHDGICVVEVRTMSPGKVAAGTFRCGALPAEGASIEPPTPLSFGKALYLSGAWHCDRWR